MHHQILFLIKIILIIIIIIILCYHSIIFYSDQKLMKISLVFILLCIISVFVGVQQIAWTSLFDVSSHTWLTLTASRLPRLVALTLTGVGLSVSGVILQQIVHNKFVEPSITGGLDASKLGILIALTFLPSIGTLGKMLFATLFCFVASVVFIVFINRLKVKNMVLVPVIGLMYGGILSAFAEFYAYQNNIIQSMQSWLLGDFSKVVQGHYEMIYVVLPILILTYLYAQRFTVVGMGEDMAKSLGINYSLTVGVGFLLVSVVTAITVITVGAIPFVGLVIPNLVALNYGENLAKTLPIIALSGACFLLICDIVGRLLIYPFEVPIALTAGSIGGVLFLILLIRGVR